MMCKAIWLETTSFTKGILNRIKNRPLVKDTISTTFFSTIGKASGFLIPFFVAACFGISAETDAFFFSYGLLLFFSGIFAPVLEQVIVPYIAEERAKKGNVGYLVGNVLVITICGLIGLAGLFILVIKPILQMITHFNPETLNLIYSLFIEMTPLMIILVITSVLAGALNAYKKFLFPAISPAFRTIICISIIFSLRDVLGVHAIAWGYVIGEACRLFFLLVVIYKVHLFSFNFSFVFNSKIKEFFRTSSLQLAGMLAGVLNPVVDKTMASWLGKGNVSILYYADRLYMIPVTLIVSGLITTLLSHWSSHHYELKLTKVDSDLKKALKWVVPIILAITIALILFYKPIVKIAFGRGAFDREKLSEVGWVWLCYLFGFIPYMISLIYAIAHLTLKNTKTLLLCAIYVNILNIFLNYILMKHFGVAGIALGTTLVSVFASFYLIYSLKKKLK